MSNWEKPDLVSATNRVVRNAAVERALTLPFYDVGAHVFTDPDEGPRPQESDLYQNVRVTPHGWATADNLNTLILACKVIGAGPTCGKSTLCDALSHLGLVVGDMDSYVYEHSPDFFHARGQRDRTAEGRARTLSIQRAAAGVALRDLDAGAVDLLLSNLWGPVWDGHVLSPRFLDKYARPDSSGQMTWAYRPAIDFFRRSGEAIARASRARGDTGGGIPARLATSWVDSIIRHSREAGSALLLLHDNAFLSEELGVYQADLRPSPSFLRRVMRLPRGGYRRI